jgi:hypothetical protein
MNRIPEGCQPGRAITDSTKNSGPGCDPSGIEYRVCLVSGGVASLDPRLMADIPSG